MTRLSNEPKKRWNGRAPFRRRANSRCWSRGKPKEFILVYLLLQLSIQFYQTNSLKVANSGRVENCTRNKWIFSLVVELAARKQLSTSERIRAILSISVTNRD